MKKILYSILFATYYLLFTVPVHADIGLSVSPPVTEVLLSPNKHVTTTIQLTNNGDDTSYTLSLHRLIPTDDAGHSTIDPRPVSPSSIPLLVNLVGADWDVPLSLAAGGTAAITLNLEGSSVDAPQDVYLALLVSPIPIDPLLSSSTTTAGITALILTTLTPLPAIPTDISLSPTHFPPLHDSLLPLVYSPSVINKAEIMLRVKGKIELKNPSGKVINESNLDPTLILGNTTRTLPPTTFTLTPTTIGPHTLTLTLETEGGRTLLTNSIVIWILPLRAIGVCLIGLLMIFALFLRHYRLTSTTQ